MPALLHEVLNDFSGGTNLRDAPLGLAPNDCIGLTNMYPIAGGGVVGRGGQSVFNQTGISASPIRSMYRFYKQDGTGVLLASNGTGMYQADEATGIFSQIGGATYTNDQRFSFTSWSAKDKVYWINGIEPLSSYDGTSGVSVFVGGSPPVGSQIEFHGDRLWILQNNLVRFSDLNTDDSWPGAAALNIADNRGGAGKFLKSANGVLIAGKSTGLWRFEGSPILGGQLTKYSNVGCVAPWSASVVSAISASGQSIPVAVVFLGDDGVYVTNGFDVQLASPKIQASVFTGRFSGAVGKYYPKLKQYWLSFNPAGAANNTLWVATTLDAVDGQKIAWANYTGFNLDAFAVFDGGNDNGEFYGGLSTGGTVHQLDTGALDIAATYECRLASRFCDFGAADKTKSVRWIKTVFDARRPVSYLLNYFDRAQFSSGLQSDNTEGLVWDVGSWDVDTWSQRQSQNTRTSTLNSGLGRYVNLTLSNTGDGAAFRVDRIEMEAIEKQGGAFELFTFNSIP